MDEEMVQYRITIVSDMPQGQLIEMIRDIAEFDVLQIVKVDPDTPNRSINLWEA